MESRGESPPGWRESDGALCHLQPAGVCLRDTRPSSVKPPHVWHHPWWESRAEEVPEHRAHTTLSGCSLSSGRLTPVEGQQLHPSPPTRRVVEKAVYLLAQQR